jgi:hypothetical protein
MADNRGVTYQGPGRVEFDSGVARKYVLDPHGVTGGAR